MAEILHTDFNQLPRATRERLVAITQNQAGPAPVFQQRAGAGAGCGWTFLMVVFGLGVCVLLAVGFGKPYTATQPVGTIALYGFSFFLFFLGVFGLARAAARKKALPYAAGIYVFAADTIIARDRNIKILSAREITSVQPVHHHRNGIYQQTIVTLSYSDGTRESFSVVGKPLAEAALQRLRNEGTQAAQAIAQRDARALYPLDPLYEARVSGFQPTDDPTGPLARSLPSWTGAYGLIALGLAIVLSPMLFGVRNVASDELAFQAADSTYEYQSYIHGGWRHVDEVREEFLPSAQLKDAVQKTDVAERIKAIQEIAAGKLVPSVRSRADAALKTALHAAFDSATAAGTVSALRDFQRLYPRAEDVPAAKVRIHELFEKTLSDFKPRASKPDSVPFVEALLRYMERNDSPPFEVRFRRHHNKTMALADQVLSRKAGPEGGTFASASSHFDADDAISREGAVISALQKGFAGVFPTDVLSLKKGAELEPDGSAPADGRPAILVDYTVGWSGATYTDAKEGRHFVGIVFDFDVLMTIPSDDKVLKLKLKVSPPDSFKVSYNTFNDPSFGDAIKNAKEGPSDSLVYEVMALRAFDQLSQKLQDEFFVAEKADAN
jgi:hypothetical protein